MTKKSTLLMQLLAPVLLTIGLMTANVAPAFADELKDIAQMADQGQQAAALDRVNAYLVKNPKDAQAMFMKGVFLVEQGKRDEATKTFVDLTEKYPNLPEPYNNLAVLYADAGQYDKAQKALETAIKTHPSYATAHENLGDIYARRASEAYDKALQLDNGNTRAQSKLALIKDLFGPNTKLASVATKATASAKDNAKMPAMPMKAAETTKPEIKTVASEAAAEGGAAKVSTSKSASTGVANSDITDAVDTWAKAWSAQNVDKYLASYSNSFKTPKGESRKEWEQTRRERVGRSAKIKVEVNNAKIVMGDDKTAKVSFKQKYSANGSPQYTAKTLLMKKVGDSWLIDQESTGH